MLRSFLGLFFMLLTGSVMAHGIQIESEERPPFVILKAVYSNGKPMVDATVKIYSPDDTVDYQNGHTDLNGVFIFWPDCAGEWKGLVDDDMGHRGHKVMIISNTYFLPDKTTDSVIPPVNPVPAESRVVIPMWYKLVWGLSLIFGLTGIFYWFKARQRLTNKE